MSAPKPEPLFGALESGHSAMKQIISAREMTACAVALGQAGADGGQFVLDAFLMLEQAEASIADAKRRLAESRGA